MTSIDQLLGEAMLQGLEINYQSVVGTSLGRSAGDGLFWAEVVLTNGPTSTRRIHRRSHCGWLEAATWVATEALHIITNGDADVVEV